MCSQIDLIYLYFPSNLCLSAWLSTVTIPTRSTPGKSNRVEVVTYTALTHPPSRVLMEIRDNEYLKCPRPLHSDPRSRDRNKYCRYHPDHVHDFDECRELKNEIEVLVRRGYLDHFMARDVGCSVEGCPDKQL